MVRSTKEERPKNALDGIPQFPTASYTCDVGWCMGELNHHLVDPKIPLVMEPDFQRGHVWTEKQQIAFVAYGLMGGESSMVLTANCAGWMKDWRGPYQLVDGLQRLTAVLRFLRGEIRVLGIHYDDLTVVDRRHMPNRCRFKWRVCNLPTRADVLKLYLLLNAGGVVHSPEEIERVRGLLKKES